MSKSLALAMMNGVCCGLSLGFLGASLTTGSAFAAAWWTALAIANGACCISLARHP